ncbi:MAG: hypothetical protein ABII22_06225 [Candidatus Micrarchaeota archaeon]
MLREISLEEAKPIWDKFVPEKEVWTDNWDIRIELCKVYNYKPLIFYDGKNFFPLQYDPDSRIHSIIGGESVEKNYLTFDPEVIKTAKELPEDILFDFMDEKFEGCVESLCPQFFIDLTKVNSIEDFMQRFSGKQKKNFRMSLEKFGEYEFRKQGNMEELAKLNIGMFGQDSDFLTEGRVCYEILDRDPRTEYWSILKNGETVVITQYFFYGTTMSVSVWGVHENYKDTLKVAIKEAINLAKSKGCARIDYAPTYSSWKFLYKLDTAPLWRYKKGNVPDSIETPGYHIPEEERARLKSEGKL